MKSKEAEKVQNPVENSESQKLDVKELLEVHGGEESDNDQDSDDCWAWQCFSGAVSYG